MTGIHHVESKNIQGMAVIKLSFYPGMLRKQRHSVDQGIAAECEEFADTDLVVRDNPSTFADGPEITIRPEGSSVASLTADP
jgi:hypothetical protein